jgi:hypothetical protein
LRLCDATWIITDIAAEYDNIPTILIRRALTRVVQEFSCAQPYRVWISIPTQEKVHHYPFKRFMPKGFTTQYVHNVRYNQCCLQQVKDKCHPCPQGYEVEGLHTIRLHGYYPCNEDSLEVEVTLRMTSEACEYPCELVERFETEFRHGVMAQLLLMGGKPWTNLQLGEFYENQFQGGMASAKVLIGNGFDVDPKDNRIEPELLLGRKKGRCTGSLF